MNHERRLLGTALLLVVIAGAACRAEKSELEQRADDCEDLCLQTQQQCADDPAFADPWTLACQVACTLEFDGDSGSFDACMGAAATCEDKNACIDAGPPTGDVSSDTGAQPSGGDTGDDTAADDGATASSTSGAASTGEATTTGGSEGHACCEISGTPCADAEVLDCTCQHMPSCCTGAWGDVCASIAVANDCIDEGCSTLDGWQDWSCSCSTTDVYCPEDPFVGQLIFGTDACGLTQEDALAIVEAACEQGDGDCQIGAGSCECTCTNNGDVCEPR